MASTASSKRRRLEGGGGGAEDGGGGSSSRSSSTSTNDSVPVAASLSRAPIIDIKAALKKSSTARAPPPLIRPPGASSRPTKGGGGSVTKGDGTTATPLPAMRKRKPAAHASPAVVNGNGNGTAAGSQGSSRELGFFKPMLDPKEERKRALEALVKGLEDQLQELESGVAEEQTRIQNEKDIVRNLPNIDPQQLDALINRLLSANDASIKKLPPKPHFDFEDAIADPAVPSVLPQPTKKPLTQLNTFHNLAFTATTTTMAPTEAGQNPRQEHRIQGHTGDRYLYFDINLVVDVKEFKVTALSCEISHWARRELTAFVVKCCAECNPSFLLYGLNSYTSLCLLRAKTFSQLCAEYPQLLPRYSSPSSKSSNGGEQAVHARRRNITPHLGSSMLRFRDMDIVKTWRAKNSKSNNGGGKSSRRSASLGLTAEAGAPEFILQWKINFTDEGDASSAIDGEARVPSAWVRIDANDQHLRRIPTMFRMLVDERGVTKATKCVVSLLFPNLQ